MISAKNMVELADKNIKNVHIDTIEKLAQARATDGKFFVKLWTGKPVSMDTQLIFVELYDLEAYSHLNRKGYQIATVRSADGVVDLYVGWGFENRSSLELALRLGEE